MLDRIGGEVARATSLVRYAPNSKFSSHVHTGGEEFLVLNGVFQDEHGDFPAGSYIRNPPQSSHTPGSDEGCVIFVKLWQFDLADRAQVRVDADKISKLETAAGPWVKMTPLFHDDRETVRMEEWSSNAPITFAPQGGLEILCLTGEFAEGGEDFAELSWLRLPVGQSLNAVAGPQGCRVWVKEGHLRYASTEAPNGAS